MVKGTWLPGVVDLTPHAGHNVHLRLDECEFISGHLAAWAAWSALALVDDSPASAITLDVTLPLSAQVASLAGSGQLLLAPGKATIKNAAVPGEFVLFLKPESVVAPEQSLTNSPFGLYYADPGELPVADYVGYNLNPVVGSGTSDGVTKSPVLTLHPSNYGRTITSWTVKLPADPPLLFLFSSGLQDGLPSPNGDTFEVAVNGDIMWRLHTSSFGWTDGSIDLSPFQGQDVFLQLITDADDTGFYVGALWAGLKFIALEPGQSDSRCTPGGCERQRHI